MSNGNRIKETTTATNLATITLAGAVASFRSFLWFPVGRRTGIKVQVGPDVNGAWLIGVYDLTSDSTLTRRAILDSSANGADVTLAAGSKEVSNTITAAQGDLIDSGTSPRVVYASSVLISDSTLGMTPTLGANQTAKIQALLDLAANGPLRLIVDVACTVDDAGLNPYSCLTIRSNTTLEFLDNCGFVFRENVTKCMFMNKNPTIDPAARQDKNITLTGLGGVVHGNRDNQSVRGDAMFNFLGVDGLYMDRPPELRKAKQFAWRAVNVYKVLVFEARVDFGPGSNEQNTDGYHFNGPSANIVVKDYTALNCGDDSLAFNADDAWGEGVHNGPFDNVYGPITNVYVDGVYLENFLYGVRLLSAGSRMDNVMIRNIRGSTGSYALVLDNYVNPANALLPGPGNFGKIFVDGVYTKNTSANATPSWTKMSIHFNAKIEQLTAINIVKSDFNNELFPIVRIGEKANIDQGEIEFRSRNYNGGNYLTEQVDIAPGAQVAQLRIKADVYANSAVSGSPVRVQAGATIKQLVLEGQGFNFTSMLNNQGTITNLHDRSFMDTAVAAASTWTLQANTPWSEDTSNPKALSYGVKSGVVASAKKNTADGFGGNVKMTGSFKFNSTTAPQADIHVAPLVRGSALVPWNTAQNGYGVDMYVNQVTSGVNLFKKVGGTQTGIGAGISGVLATNEIYSWTFIIKNSAISFMLQRNSDSLYLQSNGTWSAAANPAITATDTSLPATSGEWGVYAYNEATPAATILFNNLDIVAAP